MHTSTFMLKCKKGSLKNSQCSVFHFDPKLKKASKVKIQSGKGKFRTEQPATFRSILCSQVPQGVNGNEVSQIHISFRLQVL